ncbi:hypothetical protein H6G17_31045 [Chroococcidiopsis sp. FACHB-1243]|uniref:hypothetical protein n=1 Tax=Chroococcidiopsis sp. [FACHB-1243] TaxID=2692781 RepID=UPI0017848767|nr:hypothetical protein [Chroococcidiopsis sp. [FACHB-1243]]MBD2309852.1 hypothetical protein [Chroococcidiopsis sp. [FACHB-1243]]
MRSTQHQRSRLVHRSDFLPGIFADRLCYEFKLGWIISPTALNQYPLDWKAMTAIVPTQTLTTLFLSL